MAETLNAYFDKIVFFKVELKEDFTIYAASITSSFGDGRKQYILAFVPTHMAILDKAYITDLHWRSLQARTLANGYKIPQQKWIVPRGLSMAMFDLVDRNDSRTKYTCENDPSVEMILLHDVKKKSKFQYVNRINIIAALTSFKCVVNLIDISNARKTMAQPIPALAVRMPAPQKAYRPAEIPESSFYTPSVSASNAGANACTTKYCMYNAAKATEEDERELAQPFQVSNGSSMYRQLPAEYSVNESYIDQEDGRFGGEVNDSFELL